MKTFTEKEIEEKLNRLSKPLIEAIYSPENATSIVKISEKYGIKGGAISNVAGEIGYLILGLTKPEEFSPRLIERLDLKPSDAVSLAKDVYESVLKPLEGELNVVHGLDITTSSPQKIEKPIQEKIPASVREPIVSQKPHPPEPPRIPETKPQVVTPQRPVEAPKPLVIAPLPPRPARPPEQLPIQTAPMAPGLIERQTLPPPPVPKPVEPPPQRAREPLIPSAPRTTPPAPPRPPIQESQPTKPEPPKNVIVPQAPRPIPEEPRDLSTPQKPSQPNVFVPRPPQSQVRESDPYRETVLPSEKELPQKKDAVTSPQPSVPPFEVKKGEPPYTNPKIPPIDLRPSPTPASPQPPKKPEDPYREELS